MYVGVDDCKAHPQMDKQERVASLELQCILRTTAN